METISQGPPLVDMARPRFMRLGILGAILLLSGIAAIYYFLFRQPLQEVNRAHTLGVPETLAAKNEIRKNFVGAITALFVLATAIVALLNVRIGQWNVAVANRNVDIANKNLAVAEKNSQIAAEGQITERFVSAIELLGAQTDSGEPKIELRIGGIYALERVGVDSSRDAHPIAETLAAYVRRNAQYRPQSGLEASDIEQNPTIPREDIQAALQALTNIKEGPTGYINLQSCDLRSCDMRILPRALMVANSLLNNSLVMIEHGDINAVAADLRDAELRSTTTNERHRMMLDGANIENLTAFGFAFQGLGLAIGPERASLTGSVFENDLPEGWTVDANGYAVLPDGRPYPHELHVQRLSDFRRHPAADTTDD